MADVLQLPGVLNVRAVIGDELTLTINLNQDVTGYTFDTQVYRTVDVTIGGISDGYVTSEIMFSPSLGIVSAADGQLFVGMSEEQTSLLSPRVSYRWFLRAVAPGDITRTILAGDFLVVQP